MALKKQEFDEALQQGVAAHKEGKLQEAERFYMAILESQPAHPDANHNLGVLAVSVNNAEAALPLFKTALEANPNIEQFWLSYIDALIKLKQIDNAQQVIEQGRQQGIDGERLSSLEAQLVPLSQTKDANSAIPSQQQLNSLLEYYQNGRFSDAEKLATSISQEFPQHQFAWKVLGAVYGQTGKNSEAAYANQTAVALSPQDAEAHSNLGNTLKELGRLDEAEASYRQAIALKPDYAEAHSNLGVTLNEQGRLDEALASYNQAIALKPDYAEAMLNMSITQSCMNNLEAEIVSLKNVLRIDSYDYGLKASVNLAICKFLEGDFTESKKHLLAATKIQEETSPESKNERVYWRYLSNILEWHENKYLANKKQKNDKNLYVLGESHSLSSHHLCIQNSGVNFSCSAQLIKGCKQWHLGNGFRNQYKHQFETIFFALPKHSYVLVAIGEIDCRLDTGIIAYKRKFPEKQIKKIISNTIENYLNYIVNNNSDYQHNVTIQGVPCPNLDVRNHSEKDVRQLGEVIQIFNYELKMQSKEKGFGFLDTHQLTNKGDGMSNGSWHIDGYHLSPEGMQEAWRRYGSEKSYEQF